jgi:chromosome segregation ATPase
VTPAPRGLSLAGALLLIAGLGSAAVIVTLLGRQVARERERTVRAHTDQQGIQTRLTTANRELRAAREEAARLEVDRERRARVVEGELTTLRSDLAQATKDREGRERAWRAAAAERDRAAEDLLQARREIENLRSDLARAMERARTAEGSASDRGRAAEEAEKRLLEARTRTAALLKPLLQDLRSDDGSVRVRAHEALCAFAGRDLAYRANGTPAEREADAKAVAEALLPSPGR